MTALVIIITGAYNNPDYLPLVEANNGAGLTSRAFGEQITWFPNLLSLSVALFAYSTMISWSYYGERCWTYLFGERFSLLYKVLFITIIFLSASASASNILDFSDLMILSMAFPNMIGLLVLSGRVRQSLKEYWKRYQSGEFA